MRGDYKSRMEGYAIARQNGWMSANDIRALENLNPISEEEGGNAYLVNGNMIPISRAGLGVLLGLATQSEACLLYTSLGVRLVVQKTIERMLVGLAAARVGRLVDAQRQAGDGLGNDPHAGVNR